MSLESAVRQILALPRSAQPSAIRLALRQLPDPGPLEEWNTHFGPGSLFDAWTRTSVASGVYAANVEVLRTFLDGRPDWTAVEIGAGNGALWQRLLRTEDQGHLVAVDPVSQALDTLATHLPEGVRCTPVVGDIAEVAIPEADLVVCSLTLHHVAGRTRAERESVGLSGPGKTEVLARIADAIRPNRGVFVLNEADIHCEVDLPSGDPILVDRMCDSYVRRCGHAILEDLRRGPDEDLAARWRHILRHWCLAQLRLADVPVAERDVYELDVSRWREVLSAAGLAIEEERFTDEVGLFRQYVCRAL